jgi:putative hemolysin
MTRLAWRTRQPCFAPSVPGSTCSVAGSAGLPNPAAVLCEEHGRYDLTSGNCTLNDGRVVNAWDYFRSQLGK